MIDYFYCVDDNSSPEDRAAMVEKYPFFTYYMKSPQEKGHRESMNIIWNKLLEIRPTYWIHLEDDWLFYHTGPYISNAIGYLEKYKNQNIRQVVFNKNYGLMYSDNARVGGIVLEDGLVLHEKRDGLVGKNCGYWPHYSLQPSVILTDTILSLGNYDSANKFFERDYAEKYFAAGYKTAFFPSIYSIHIGKQHWEKDGKNAYALNSIDQFNSALAISNTEADLQPVANVPLTGTMRDHLNAILEKIRTRTPFGIIRPSDGEYSILLGKTLTNCDNWTFTAGDSIQKQLTDAVQTVDPNLYIGIPCNTCNKEWNCTQAIYSDFIDRFHVPIAQRTYANIFGNSNWKVFSAFMKSYTPGFFMITSGKAHSDLPIKERFIINEKLLNVWNTEGEAETARLLQFIRNKKNELFCFSAGPLSKIWIPMCMKENPQNMYVDIGATLDIFTKQKMTRGYVLEEGKFSKESCLFNDTLVKQKPSTNLVYMCVFHKIQYIELLQILLTSIKLFSKTDGIDFLICTTKEFEGHVRRISAALSIPLLTHFFDFTTFREATSARLFIHDYPRINEYSKILYIDTDIVIQGDLTELFRLPLEDRVYALEEGTIEHEYHGGWFFNFDLIDPATPGINSGVLLFNNTSKIRTIFHSIHKHITSMKQSGSTMPSCHDQPFVNYHCIKEDAHNSQVLKQYVEIYCDTPPPPPSSPTDIRICHFVWPIGDASHKKERMLNHMTHILWNYKSIYNCKDTYTNRAILYKVYSWGEGVIRFGRDILYTTWGDGSYSMLDEYTVEVNWLGHSHIIRMNDGFDKFVGVRKGDLELVDGKVCNFTM